MAASEYIYGDSSRTELTGYILHIDAHTPRVPRAGPSQGAAMDAEHGYPELAIMFHWVISPHVPGTPCWVIMVQRYTDVSLPPKSDL